MGNAFDTSITFFSLLVLHLLTESDLRLGSAFFSLLVLHPSMLTDSDLRLAVLLMESIVVYSIAISVMFVFIEDGRFVINA